MQIELSDAEAVLLRTALETRLREMRDELAHTDDRTYHAALKRDLESLERIDHRITLVIGASALP